MDVKGDHAWTGPDTAATAVVPTLDPGTGPATMTNQGQLFSDAYPTFADTDRIPVVGPERGAGGPGPSRWLRGAVLVVALAVLAAGAVLALAQTGVIGQTGTGTNTTTTGAAAARGNGSSAGRGASNQHGSTAALVTKTSTGPSSADYTIHAAAYRVTVTTTSGRCWVSIAALGHAPSFAGIIPASSSQSVSMLGPATVELGAGGSRVTLVAPGRRSVTLTPPTAPFTYNVTYHR